MGTKTGKPFGGREIGLARRQDSPGQKRGAEDLVAGGTLTGMTAAGGGPAGEAAPGEIVTDEGMALLRAKLLGETATAPWRELQRFFAQGVVVWVTPELDLIEVGLAMSGDRADLFRAWLDSGRAALATDQQARDWLVADAHLWTLVIRPWILVQEMAPDPAQS